MKLHFRHAVGASLLAAAAFAGCSAIERGINQFERGFDDEPPNSGFRSGVYAEPFTETTPIAEPVPYEPSPGRTPPTPSTSLRRESRPTDFLIEPQEDGPALVPPPSPAPLPIEGTPAAFRGGNGNIRPICFTSSSCCPTVVNCDPCCAPVVTCDPCMTSCCPDSCCSTGCGESLLSKMHRGFSNMNGRMHCFKARMKSKLSNLSPFGCSTGCDPCATCCDPCASCCTPCCDPCNTCCDGVVLDGVVVGSYPAGPGVTYGQPTYGYGPSYPQPGCSTCQQHTWQPQYSQVQTWQGYRPQPTYQQAQPQYAQPQYAQPQYAQPQYAQPRYAHPQQYGAPQNTHPHPVRQFPQPQPGTPVYGPQPGPAAQPGGAVGPGAVGPGAVGPGAAGPGAGTPTPAGVSHTPGTALLGPGYAPRTVPVTRHLQTTYTTVR